MKGFFMQLWRFNWDKKREEFIAKYEDTYLKKVSSHKWIRVKKGTHKPV